MPETSCKSYPWEVVMPDGSTRTGASPTLEEAKRAATNASTGFTPNPQDAVDAYTPTPIVAPGLSAPTINNTKDPMEEVPHSEYIKAPIDDPRLDEIRDIHNVAKMSPPAGATEALIHPNYQNPTMIGAVVAWETPDGRRFVYSQYHQRTRTSQMHARRRQVASRLPDLDKEVFDTMGTDDAAAAVAIMRFAGIRVDSSGGKSQSKNAKAKPIYGATSLQARHVAIHDGVAYLRFLGKQQRVNTATIKNPRIVAMLAKRLEGKGPNDALFPKANDSNTSALVKKHLGEDSTNHDLRRQYASARAASLIKKMDAPQSTEEYIEARNTVAQEVGALINDNPKIALERYIDTTLFDTWRRAIGLTPVSAVDHEAPEVPADATADDKRKHNLTPSAAQLNDPLKLFADADGMFSTLNGWVVKRTVVRVRGKQGKMIEKVQWAVYPPRADGLPAKRASTTKDTKTDAQDYIRDKTPQREKARIAKGDLGAYFAPEDFGDDWGITDVQPVEDHTDHDLLPTAPAGAPGGDILASAQQTRRHP